MASIEPETPTPEQLGETSAELGREIAKLRAEMKRVAELAGMRDDPALPLITVLASSLDAQWRLHNQAVRYFRSASERLDRQYVETMAQAEAALDAKRVAVVEGLVPQLAETVKASVRGWNRSVMTRTVLLAVGLVAVVVIAAGCLCYGSGYEAGENRTLVSLSDLPANLKGQGADTAVAVSDMVRYNDLGALMKECRKNAIAAEKRHGCWMGLWLDASDGLKTGAPK